MTQRTLELEQKKELLKKRLLELRAIELAKYDQDNFYKSPSMIDGWLQTGKSLLEASKCDISEIIRYLEITDDYVKLNISDSMLNVYKNAQDLAQFDKRRIEQKECDLLVSIGYKPYQTTFPLNVEIKRESVMLGTKQQVPLRNIDPTTPENCKEHVLKKLQEAIDRLNRDYKLDAVAESMTLEQSIALRRVEEINRVIRGIDLMRLATSGEWKKTLSMLEKLKEAQGRTKYFGFGIFKSTGEGEIGKVIKLVKQVYPELEEPGWKTIFGWGKK